jgi:hypothetical protein
MGMTLTGTVKNGGAYDIKGKDGSVRVMISFNVADELGNTFSCQMWPDNPQHAELAGIIAQMRYQPVQLAVVSYTARMRTFKDGRQPAPQANFIVSNVHFPQLQQNGAAPAPAGAPASR